MSREIVFRPEVKTDVDDAFRWYERQVAGLGEKFLQAVAAEVERLAEDAESYPVLFRGVRAKMTVRFPYVIYFRVRPKRVEVLAIVHGHRDPRIWKRRR